MVKLPKDPKSKSPAPKRVRVGSNRSYGYGTVTQSDDSRALTVMQKNRRSNTMKNRPVSSGAQTRARTGGTMSLVNKRKKTPGMSYRRKK